MNWVESRYAGWKSASYDTVKVVPRYFTQKELRLTVGAHARGPSILLILAWPRNPLRHGTLASLNP